MRSIGLILGGFILVAGVCSADSVVADFVIENGSPSASGGQVTFLLNSDGTIGASLVSYGLNIVGLDFASNAIDLPESNFSDSDMENSGGFVDLYGYQHSGIDCLSCGTTATWTIGTPGDFSSVFDVLGNSDSQHDFFFLDSGENQWAADAVRAVPEPSLLPVLAGMMLAAVLCARRQLRRSSHGT